MEKKNFLPPWYHEAEKKNLNFSLIFFKNAKIFRDIT